jgi:hypothetical protein
MALTAASLPERHAYPDLFAALSGLLDAICAAPSYSSKEQASEEYGFWNRVITRYPDGTKLEIVEK